jgi:hypothetical protein
MLAFLCCMGHSMDAEEFYETAKIYDTSVLRKTVDVSPFGDQQGEAVDFYLNELVLKIATEPAFTASKPTVVSYDHAINFRESTIDALGKLLSMGVAIEVKRADS